MKKKEFVIGILVLAAAAVIAYIILSGNKLQNAVVLPYISHQAPVVDPHLPDVNPLSDKLDEVEFDGLFNVSSNKSGIVYEDGLGTFLGIDNNDVVSIKLKNNVKWSDSYEIKSDDDEVKLKLKKADKFTAEDLAFTLKRIENLGSLSPDYILIAQALENIGFSGPDKNGVIKFQFKHDRIWKESDIKEVLSFKVLPKSSDMNALNYYVGTGSYLAVPQKTGVANYFRNPDRKPFISYVKLKPFIDNSTFTTELKNNNINVLLESPFGAVSPILDKDKHFFAKPGISTTYFGILFNTNRLNLEQREALRAFLNQDKILARFYKIGTPQQRDIIDYKGNRNNFNSLLNYTIFPSSSYYVEEKIVQPNKNVSKVDLQNLPDSINIVACVNYGYREEYNALISILNSPEISQGKIYARAVTNDEIKKQNYDAVIVAFTGYRSNFLFDLYDIFLREPDLSARKINLILDDNGHILPASFTSDKNFFGLDAQNSADNPDVRKLLDYTYGFMSTHEIGDKQAYAERVDKLENKLALGKWLFSLPTLSYFSNQFDSTSIELYGVASQLSTIEKWKEKKK